MMMTTTSLSIASWRSSPIPASLHGYFSSRFPVSAEPGDESPFRLLSLSRSRLGEPKATEAVSLPLGGHHVGEGWVQIYWLQR
jgi:hypothetical protein